MLITLMPWLTDLSLQLIFSFNQLQIWDQQPTKKGFLMVKELEFLDYKRKVISVFFSWWLWNISTFQLCLLRGICENIQVWMYWISCTGKISFSTCPLCTAAMQSCWHSSWSLKNAEILRILTCYPEYLKMFSSWCYLEDWQERVVVSLISNLMPPCLLRINIWRLKEMTGKCSNI